MSTQLIEEQLYTTLWNNRTSVRYFRHLFNMSALSTHKTRCSLPSSMFTLFKQGKSLICDALSFLYLLSYLRSKTFSFYEKRVILDGKIKPTTYCLLKKLTCSLTP